MKAGWNWDLTSFFPGFNSPEMVEFRQNVKTDLAKLVTRAQSYQSLNAATLGEWEEMLVSAEGLMSRFHHLYTFVECLCSTDARNAEYLKESAAMAALSAEFSKLEVEFLRALKKAKKADIEALKHCPGLKNAEYHLDRLREEARKAMSTDQEVLAAELGVDGISAWGRLYNQLTGKMEFEMEFPDGRKEKRPLAQRRSLMEDADPRIRKTAFVNGNKVFAEFEDVMANALNHIAGTRLTLNKHRNYEHFLDVALFQSRISKKTLDAIFAAIDETLDLPQRIARAKAKALGQKSLGWQDQEAPMPVKDDKRFEWEAGKAKVKAAFHNAFPELAEFLQMCIDKKWIEAEEKSGKRPGAYCTGSPLTKESRVYMTFGGSLGDLSTLAHEIGHAYHSHVMKDLRVYARSYPMTLAESASTFAEMIFIDGVPADPHLPESLKLNILNMQLNNAIAFLINIPIRYRFEKAFHEDRMKGEVPTERIKQLMVESQQHYFGAALTKGEEDPYFWASKLHFYITEVTFYNFPYTFGFLLSRGLFAQLKKEGPSFLPKYKEFLKLSGSFPAEEVAMRTIGLDLTKKTFWINSIRSMESDLKRFEDLVLKH